MRESNFWNDLEKQFRSIEDGGKVSFQWVDFPTPTHPESWDMSFPDFPLHTARLKFETLARRAAARLEPLCCDGLSAWLSHLKWNGRPDLVKFFEGMRRGRIDTVRIVAADCCLKLESKALGRERLARYERERQSKLGSAPAESLPTSDGKAARRQQVEIFVRECNAISATLIYKSHIWRLVGHSKGRQFEYWQACSPKATDGDNGNFSRVLNMGPQKFVALVSRRLIPRR
jgi:hypothetical protein